MFNGQVGELAISCLFGSILLLLILWIIICTGSGTNLIGYSYKEVCDEYRNKRKKKDALQNECAIYMKGIGPIGYLKNTIVFRVSEDDGDENSWRNLCLDTTRQAVIEYFFLPYTELFQMSSKCNTKKIFRKEISSEAKRVAKDVIKAYTECSTKEMERVLVERLPVVKERLMTLKEKMDKKIESESRDFDRVQGIKADGYFPFVELERENAKKR